MEKTVETLLAGLDETLRARMLTLRRWLHQHAELSFHEVDTAARIVKELERLGIRYAYAGEGHAVLGYIDGADSTRPAIALRAEMDALPGEESTGVPYRSINPGVMHACGHGAHMAMLIGAAELLTQRPPPGPVRLVFQPAEERGGGARTAIADGALENVAAIFAAHVTHEYETGKIMVRDGAVTAQSDRFSISIRGKGGHGARPHEAVDAVVICGFLIAALQTLVSREVNPLHPSVVTIGQIHAGSAPNVIAEQAELHGSIRTMNPDIREHLHRGLRRMVGAAAELHNAEISIDIEAGYPPVINDAIGADIARIAARDVVGETAVVAAEFPSMGSEDFAFYLQQTRGAFVRFGARHPDWEPVALHSPAFNIDEHVLGIGALYFDRLVRTAHANLERLSHAL